MTPRYEKSKDTYILESLKDDSEAFRWHEWSTIQHRMAIQIGIEHFEEYDNGEWIRAKYERFDENGIYRLKRTYRNVNTARQGQTISGKQRVE